MRHIRFVSLAAAVAVFLASSAVSAAALTDLLVSKVGVTPVQAEGGAGSIFKLAKSQLTADNFAKIKNAVPGMDKYLAAAPAVAPAAPASAAAGTTEGTLAGTTEGTLAGAAAQALGGSGPLGNVGGKLATMQQLAPAFESLGMKGKVVGKFVPVVVDYLKSSGGKATAKLLTGALGF